MCTNEANETKKLVIGVAQIDVKESKEITESGKLPAQKDNAATFLCPKEMEVLVGRYHRGDENGTTMYRYGKLSILANDDENEYEIFSSDALYSEYYKESNSEFSCPEGALLVGREHTGDENGQTRYMYREFFVRNKKTKTTTAIFVTEADKVAVTKKESADEWIEAPQEAVDKDGIKRMYYRAMIGRKHMGDENAETTTTFSLAQAKLI